MPTIGSLKGFGNLQSPSLYVGSAMTGDFVQGTIGSRKDKATTITAIIVALVNNFVMFGVILILILF